MIRLFLLRHGNTFEANQTPTQVGARTDLPLTTHGRQQAEDFARYLQAQQIYPTAIFAGALQRQIDSARIIHQTFPCQIALHQSALTEIDYGLWEGLSAQEIAHRWPEAYLQWTEAGRWADAHFGGHLQQHLTRIQQWLSSLQTHPSGTTLIAVTSNGLLRFFHNQWTALAAAKQMEILKVKTGHFCELHLYPDHHEVVSWNVKPLYIS